MQSMFSMSQEGTNASNSMPFDKSQWIKAIGKVKITNLWME